jgi:hypothetical protein
MALRVLLVDNFDSYTFNLYQRLAAVSLPAGSASSSSGDVRDSHEVAVAATEPEDVPVSMPAPFGSDALRCAIESGWVGVEGWRRAGSRWCVQLLASLSRGTSNFTEIGERPGGCLLTLVPTLLVLALALALACVAGGGPRCTQLCSRGGINR